MDVNNKVPVQPKDQRLIRGNKTFQTLKMSLLELLDEKPYENITVDEICSRSGVTKGAYYHHIDTKEDLLKCVLSEKLDVHMFCVIAKAQEDYPEMPLLQMREWIKGLYDFTHRNKRITIGRLFNGTHSDRWRDYYVSWPSAVNECFVKWQKKGILRQDVSALQLHQYLDCFTYGIASLYTTEYIDQLVDERLVNAFLQTLIEPEVLTD